MAHDKGRCRCPAGRQGRYGRPSEDVGLDAKKLTFSEKDWNALEDVVDPLVPEAKGEY